MRIKLADFEVTRERTPFVVSDRHTVDVILEGDKSAQVVCGGTTAIAHKCGAASYGTKHSGKKPII
jgi:hypothetical protein